jgi:hypothetical protein
MLKGELSSCIALTTLMVSKAKATLVDGARSPLVANFGKDRQRVEIGAPIDASATGRVRNV